MTDTLIKVEGVSKKFCRSLKKSLWYGLQDLGQELRGRRHCGNGELRPDEFWAVKDVSFEVKRGECLGLIGRNGAGKTTLLRMLNGLIKPDQGRIEMRGRVGALIALAAGFNPILTGRENVYVNASVLGLSKADINDRLQDIIEFAEIGDFIDSPVQSYSSGMQVRLGFAVATALRPEILILDEVLAVGDTAFRAKCFDRIGKILSGTAVVFVSHDENQVRRICDQVLMLRQGIQAFRGDTEVGLRAYREEVQVAVQGQVVCSPLLSSPEIRVVTPQVHWGDDLVLEVSFDASERVFVGLLLVHLFHQGTFPAHADLTAQNPVIEKGKNLWRLTLKALRLIADRYYVGVTVFAADRRATVLHMVNLASFAMEGARGYGPSVLQDATFDAVTRPPTESAKLESGDQSRSALKEAIVSAA